VSLLLLRFESVARGGLDPAQFPFLPWNSGCQVKLAPTAGQAGIRGNAFARVMLVGHGDFWQQSGWRKIAIAARRGIRTCRQAHAVVWTVN
jgi:hypothetical protein